MGILPFCICWLESIRRTFLQGYRCAKFVNMLKLRVSYGILGDDGDLNYDWAMGYTYPATSGNMANGDYNQYSPGYIFGNKFVASFFSYGFA